MQLKVFSILSLKHEQFIVLMLIIIIKGTIMYSRRNGETRMRNNTSRFLSYETRTTISIDLLVTKELYEANIVLCII